MQQLKLCLRVVLRPFALAPPVRLCVCECVKERVPGERTCSKPGQARTRSRQAGHRRIVERGAFNLRIWLFKKCIKGAKGRGRRDGEKETGQEAAQITANVNNVQPQTDTE